MRIRGSKNLFLTFIIELDAVADWIKLHSIWSYSLFEALKVRDPRLEPVPYYHYYEDIRKDS